MSEMVERVRRAIVAAIENQGRLLDDDLSEPVARAAIEAMREPTATMVEASNREWDGRMSHRSSGAWQAMIDAALVTNGDRVSAA